MIGHEELLKRFGYHAATPDTAPKHDEIRSACYELADTIDHMAPDGREKSLALTALQEAAMWANAAIAGQAPLVVGPDAWRARQ